MLNDQTSAVTRIFCNALYRKYCDALCHIFQSKCCKMPLFPPTISRCEVGVANFLSKQELRSEKRKSCWENGIYRSK